MRRKAATTSRRRPTAGGSRSGRLVAYEVERSSKVPAILTRKARSNWDLVPLTRANTPLGSIDAVSPSLRIATKNALRVEVEAPKRRAISAVVRNRR